MANACTSCKLSTSDPFKFLLCCIQCGTFWHHRCHRPPVSDKELIEIIKLYNLEKQKPNKKPTFVWRCGACVAKPKVVDQPPKAGPSNTTAVLAPNRPAVPSRPQTRPEPIIIDDSDENDSDIVILDNPPVQPQPQPSITTTGITHAKKTTRTSASGNNTNVVPPTNASKDNQTRREPFANAIDIPVRSAAATTAAGKSSTSSISNGFVNTVPPAPPFTSTSVSDRPVHAQASSSSTITRPSGIRIIDDPFINYPSPPRASTDAPTRSTTATTPTPSFTTAARAERPPLIAHASSTSSSTTLLSGFGDLRMSTDGDEDEAGDRVVDVPMHIVPPHAPQDPPPEDDDDELEYLTPPAPLASARSLPASAMLTAQPLVVAASPTRLVPPQPRSPYVRIAHSLPPIVALVPKEDDEDEDEDDDEDEEDEIEQKPAVGVNAHSKPLLLPAWINEHWDPSSFSSSSSSNNNLTGKPKKAFSRKFKAQNLSTLDQDRVKASQMSFVFTADVWMSEKKRDLPHYPPADT